MDKQEIIYDLVKDIKSDQDHIKNDIIDIKLDIRVHSTSLERYNELLNIHIEGVNTLKKLHLDNAKRIELLEEPIKINKAIVKRIVKLTGFIAVLATAIHYIITFK